MEPGGLRERVHYGGNLIRWDEFKHFRTRLAHGQICQSRPGPSHDNCRPSEIVKRIFVPGRIKDLKAMLFESLN